MKIDIFAHVIPQKYVEAVNWLMPGPYSKVVEETIGYWPSLNDLEQRFRVMDGFGEYGQVLTISTVHQAMFGNNAVELAKVANDELAELTHRHPDRFLAAVAILPMNDMDACLKEADRAINDLKLRGVELWASPERKPLDSPELMPLYEKMCEFDLPIWIHPHRGPAVADYNFEKESRYNIFSIFGWVYDTTVAMTRLVFSQVLEKYPNLKLITHHCGGMVPYLADRLASHCDTNEISLNMKHNEGLTKHPTEYFRMFYADTALNGSPSGLKCGYDFLGAGHLLFGTDMPTDCQNGVLSISKTIEAIEQMDIPEQDKKKIFEGNARKLLRLAP